MTYHRPWSAVSVLVVVMTVVLAGCSLVQYGRSQAVDERFEQFTEHVPDKIEVKSTLESATSRMPQIHASQIHFVGEYRMRESESQLPDPDRPYWFHAVISVEPTTSQALEAAASGPATLLPPVYPGLHDYVPQDCAFTEVPAEAANEVLGVPYRQESDLGEGFHIDQLALSPQCELLVLTGTGGPGQAPVAPPQ